jgi:tetratricopeptide (TPR) repeat protein
MHRNAVNSVLSLRARQRLCGALCAACLSVPAWAGASRDVYQGAPDVPYVETPAAKYEYHVLAGEMAVERGNRALAAREYAAAVQFSNNPKLAERATRIAVYANQPADAYRAAKVWSDGALQSVEAQRAATRLAFATGDSAGTLRYARRLISAAPSADAGYRLLAQLLSGEPEKSELALNTMKRLVADAPQSALAQFALGSLALSYNQLPAADRAAQAAQKLDPGWADAALLRAGVLIGRNRPGAAAQQIEALSGSASKRAQYHVSLARLLLQAGRTKAGRDQFKRAVAIDPSDGDARFGWALVSLDLDDLDVSRTQFKYLYDHQDRADDAAFYLGLIANQRKKYAQAEHWYKLARNGNHAFEAQLRGAQMIYRQGHLDQARDRLAQLRKVYPNQVTQIRSAESDLLFDAGQYQEALALLNKALSDSPDDMDLRYQRSLVYERIGRTQAAETDLRAMLSQDQNDPRALNALGYMLTNHSSEYERARDLIRRALKADPDNPAVLDSMGWVQYKLGELDKARHNLQKAYKGSPGPEIAAHLGEVRWQQGDHKQARKVWKEAHALHPDNAVLNKTMKRFGS